VISNNEPTKTEVNRIVHENNEPLLRKSPCQAGAWRSFWERQAPAWPLDGMFFIGYHLSPRHFGRDAEIQAMEGNVPVLRMFNLSDLPARSFKSLDTQTHVITHSLPSLDAGFRHPCRNDGSPTLVYNGERGAWGQKNSPAMRAKQSGHPR